MRITGTFGILLILLTGALSGGDDGYEISCLGTAKSVRGSMIFARSVGPKGESYGWIGFPEKQGIYRITVPGGETKFFDMSAYRGTHILFYVSILNRQLYVYMGSPGHFLKYDPVREEFADLGVPFPRSGYVLNYGADKDGRMYVGAFPGHLLELNTENDTVRDLGKISANTRQQYILSPQIDKDGILYCYAGKAENELFAIDLKNGRRNQLLPPELKSSHDAIAPVLGPDGVVYARKGEQVWKLGFDGMEPSKVSLRGDFSYAKNLYNGKFFIQYLDNEGRAVYSESSSGEVRKDPTAYPGVVGQVLSFHFRDGNLIYGGGKSPGCIFTVNLENGSLSEVPVDIGGKVQVYDGIKCGGRYFISSYPLGAIDLFEPETGKSKPVVRAGQLYGQERVLQLCQGSDGKIYGCTIPNKGKLGGGLLEIDPATLKTEFHANIEKDQSFSSVVSVPATGELLLASLTRGGTGAAATTKEAKLILWDPKTKTVRWSGAPGISQGYMINGVAPDGLVYGTGVNRSFFVFDPVKRKFIHTGRLPTGYSSSRWVYLNGGFYIIVKGKLYFLDPRTFAAKETFSHPSLSAYASFTDGKDIYYGGYSGEIWKIGFKKK